MVTQRAVQPKIADCPDCGAKITLQGEIKMGRRVTYPNCEADLEVVETAPVELSWYYEEPEDDDADW
jgi:lysine biosynthesis protein LysW